MTFAVSALAEHLHTDPQAGRRLLWSAILAGNETVVAHHLDHGEPVPPEQLLNLLEQAVRGWRLGDLKICNDGWDRRSCHRNLQRLVDAGFDLRQRSARAGRADYTILHHLAARACHPGAHGHTDAETVDFARILIDGGADVDRAGADWARPLAWAERYGHHELTRMLRAAGAQWPVNGHRREVPRRTGVGPRSAVPPGAGRGAWGGSRCHLIRGDHAVAP